MTLRDWIVVYLKGVAMGAADTVPGVSGGTIALITGIYERLVAAFAALSPAPLQHLRQVHRSDARRALLDDFEAMDVPFLLVLGAGIATAVVVLSRFMHTALVQYPAPTNALFFGLIGASTVVLLDSVSLDTPRRVLVAAGGFLAAFLVTGVSGGGGLGHALPVVFVAGAVASAAMLLPGISGAAFLYILGQYAFLTGRLSRFVDALLAFPRIPPTLAADAAVITVFLAGVGTGLVTIARAVERALERDRATTLTVLVALMAGSLRLPVENVVRETAAVTPVTAAGVLLPASAGAAAVLLLDRYTDEMQY
ncbi:MAG: DUF368 domain-containing protein [Candidatus Nanohaloarchaea archaeon]|nr:DUF368 domain-containing protein [Candidatus Nanohaloarchaea archaeon]